MTNEELVQKAIITTSDIASAGKLNDEQSDQFIDYVIDVTELRGSVRVARFRAENMDIDKLGVGTRVSVPKSEAKDPGLRRGVTASKVTLTPKSVMTPFEISDNFAELNIEGEAVEDTVVRLMATQTANDMEEVLVNGDTLGPAQIEGDIVDGGSASLLIKDTFLAMFNGWLRLADSGNVYDAEDENISTKVFSEMIKSMPVKFRRTRRNLRFLLAMDIEQNWREKVSARIGNAGDNAMTSNEMIPVYGVPMVPVPLLEAQPRVVKHVTLGAHPSTASLGYTNISSTYYVNASTLGSTPAAAYTDVTDYTIDTTNGTISTTVAGALAGGATVKVTFFTQAQVLLTEFQNLIIGIGKDITIERDRDIYKSVNQFAITTKYCAQIEEVTAIVKGINIGIE